MLFSDTNPLIESCCEKIDEAINAWQNGANRIEYCADLSAQGLTPKVSEVESLLLRINIPVRPIIRPRDLFTLDQSDLQEMQEHINAFKSISIDGFVLGMVDSNDRIDWNSLEKILRHTDDYPITIHKAIDQSPSILEDIMVLNNYPTIDYILTSGGKRTAMEGAYMIRKMDDLFNGIIMAGGSITRSNLDEHKSILKLNAYHGRRII